MPVIECISPVDGSVYAARESLNLAAAQGVASRARKAQKAWARRPLEDRIQLVMKGVARLNEMTDEVVPELAWQMGRPVRYGGEFKGFNERVNYVAGIAGSMRSRRIVIEHSDQFERGIEREPHGVVFVIAPWNYPYMTAINTVAPALMAGNSVILKHASQTLLVGERLVRAFNEAGVPEDVFQNVFLDHDVTSALIAARCFDFINFTGSVEGGRSIERAAAGTFTAVGLELGGKDPGYVMEDADLDAAVDTLMDGATYNSGQCCCGIERIYVTEKLYDAFVEKSVAWVSNYKLGNPLDADTTLGPMAHKRFAAAVRDRRSRDAVAKGAQDAGRSEAASRPMTAGPIVAPQILVNVDHSMDLMTEETFGPTVGIMKVRSDAEALALMNDSQIRPDGIALDQGYGPRHAHWPGDRNRHRVHEPRRLSRSGAVLDRRQGDRPRRLALGHRLPQPYTTQILSLQEITGMTITANWSYPTAIKFGAGRIKELADHCKAVGIKRPLLVTDRGLAPMAITQNALDILDAAGLGRAIFADVDPNPNDRNLDAGVNAFKAGGHDGVVAFGGGSGLDLGKCVAFMAGQIATGLGFRGRRRLVDPRQNRRYRANHCGPDDGGDGIGSRPRLGHHQFGDAYQEGDLPPEISAFRDDLRSRADRRHAKGHHRRHRHGRLRALPRSLLLAVLPSDEPGHRARRDAARERLSAARLWRRHGYRGPRKHDVGSRHGRGRLPEGARRHPLALASGRRDLQHAPRHDECGGDAAGADASTDRRSRTGSPAPQPISDIAGGFDGFYDYVLKLRQELGVPDKLSALGVGTDRIDEMAAMAIVDPTAGGNPIELTLDAAKRLFVECIG